LAEGAPPAGSNTLASDDSVTAGAKPSTGLVTFLTRWEMNDFLFLLVIENVKTGDVIPNDQEAWFSILPEAPRRHIVNWLCETFPSLCEDRWGAAFLAARAFTLGVFALVATGLLWRCVRKRGVLLWLESVFLTLAWFWLLSPTLNPWYWTWVLPLLPFARNRIWLAVSGLVLIYYLRFWLIYQFAETNVPGTRYVGIAFFDLVVTWIEFGPWLVCLFATWVYRRRGGGTVASS
jgi:hypothetical protein